MSGKIFVFDFDGVLFDTRNECLKVAFEAAKMWPFGERWQNDLEPSRKITEQFLQYRYVVGPPWQYGVLLELLSQGKAPNSRDEFFDLARQKANSFNHFSETYFSARAKLGDRLLQYIKPYRESVAIFCHLLAEKRAFILSTRNAKSIEFLFMHFLGIELPAGCLLATVGQHCEKWQILQEKARASGLNPSQIAFFDDYIQYLIPMQKIGFQVYLAKWGYLGPNDIETALNFKLPCVDLNNLESIVVRGESPWLQHY